MSKPIAKRSSASLSKLADLANKYHGEAERYIGTALKYARKAGEHMIEAKSRLDHGEWMPWLEQHFNGSYRTAAVYMRIAREWPDIESKVADSANLSINEALALVAEPRDTEADDDAGEAEADDGAPEQDEPTPAGPDDGVPIGTAPEGDDSASEQDESPLIGSGDNEVDLDAERDKRKGAGSIKPLDSLKKQRGEQAGGKSAVLPEPDQDAPDLPDAVAAALNGLPSEEHAAATRMVSGPGVPDSRAVEMLENLADMDKGERTDIYTLHASNDDRDRSLAVSRAARMPPNPDPAAGILFRLVKLMGECVKALDRHPEKAERLAEMRDEVTTMKDDLYAHERTA